MTNNDKVSAGPFAGAFFMQFSSLKLQQPHICIQWGAQHVIRMWPTPIFLGMWLRMFLYSPLHFLFILLFVQYKQNIKLQYLEILHTKSMHVTPCNGKNPIKCFFKSLNCGTENGKLPFLSGPCKGIMFLKRTARFWQFIVRIVGV